MEKSIHKADRTMEWILSAVIIIAVIFGIFQLREDNNLRGGHRNEVYCTIAEADAQSIAAVVADYLSNPEHITVPTINGDSKYLGYTLNNRKGQNIAWVSGTVQPEFAVTIVVKDASGKCPTDYQEINRGWNSGKFTLNM